MRDATSFGLASSAFSWPWIRVCTDRSLSWFRLLSSSAGSMAAAAAAAAAAAWRAVHCKSRRRSHSQSGAARWRRVRAARQWTGSVSGGSSGRGFGRGHRGCHRLVPCTTLRKRANRPRGLQRRSSDWPTELQMRIHRFDSSRRRQAHRVVQPLPRRLRLRRLACVASCRHTTKEPAPEGGRCITRTTYWPFLTLPAGAPTLSSESPLAPWPQP